jgi:putative FmdB family regulatory protein
MIYQYACKDCGHNFEVTKKLSEIDRPEPCRECESSETHRVISVPGFTTSESLGRLKAPEDFRFFLKRLHKNTPGSMMELD